ncbi:uncharacterized protein LOC106180661 isoform X2 [Lingula anatina]|uniref:Uncharacterized protein LOC106180661 isoform X2 n=1 Tax=Lingula anatina TaxID=7574 RepID=A0A1S3KD27_LINAN|nr:uncharacterized protein LOC106180661 isoform X2 [Lingula anatina]|eukprot:XP_013420161.1 uncharacterized protein LOC106180661 isoform X2 [Lingula anatina]
MRITLEYVEIRHGGHVQDTALEVAMLILDIVVLSFWILSTILFYRGIAKMSLSHLFPWFLMTVAVTGVFVYKLIRDFSNADHRFRDKPINITWFVISFIAVAVNTLAVLYVLQYMRENNRKFMSKRVEQRPLPESIGAESPRAAAENHSTSIFGPPVYMDPTNVVPSTSVPLTAENNPKCANDIFRKVLSPFVKKMKRDEGHIYLNSEPVESSLLGDVERSAHSLPGYANSSVLGVHDDASATNNEQEQSGKANAVKTRRPVALPRCRHQDVSGVTHGVNCYASSNVQNLGTERCESIQVNSGVCNSEQDSEEAFEYIYDDIIPVLPQQSMTNDITLAEKSESGTGHRNTHCNAIGSPTTQGGNCQEGNCHKLESGSELKHGHVSKMKALLFGSA